MLSYEDELPSSDLKERLQSLLTMYRFHILALLGISLLIGIGVLLSKGFFSRDTGHVEVIEATSSAEVKGTTTQEIVVEVSGEVQNPGVYHFSPGARIDDLLEKAGGVTEDAATEWLSKALNRAAKLSDGQKLYIPKVKEIAVTMPNNQSSVPTAKDSSTPTEESVSRTIISQPSQSTTNINTASLSELDKLPGIGQVYGQKIIDHRPYSDINELMSKKVIPSATYQKIKDKISVY